jgi:hypothetical protein
MGRTAFIVRERVASPRQGILVLAVSTDDLEIRNMRRVIAAGYEKLARRIEQRAREAVKA